MRLEYGETRAWVIALPGVVPLDVSLACQVLGVDLPLAGVACRVGVCGEAAGLVPTCAGFGLHVNEGPEALAKAHLVVVAGMLPPDPKVRPEVLDALRAVHARGVPVVAVGTAAFVLARAGLLDGRRATTHWSHAGELARRYPRITVDPGATGVEDRGVFTGCGLSAAIELCLPILRGQRIPVADGSEPVPAPAAGRGLTDVREWMVSHLDQNVTVGELADRAFMSRRQFTRKFRAEVGTSPWQWVLGQRLVRARLLLEETDDQIESIARRCGFSTALALRTLFKQAFGTSPSEYRRSRRAANRVAV